MLVNWSYTIERRDSTSSSQMDIGVGTFGDAIARLSCNVVSVGDGPHSWIDGVVPSSW